MPVNIELGEILTLKKVHPCGSKTWEVLRVGADFKLRCTGCQHQIMISRVNLEKSLKNKK